MNFKIVRSFLGIFLIVGIFQVSILTACGGGDTDETTQQNADQTALQETPADAKVSQPLPPVQTNTPDTTNKEASPNAAAIAKVLSENPNLTLAKLDEAIANLENDLNEYAHLLSQDERTEALQALGQRLEVLKQCRDALCTSPSNKMPRFKRKSRKNTGNTAAWALGLPLVVISTSILLVASYNKDTGAWEWPSTNTFNTNTNTMATKLKAAFEK